MSNMNDREKDKLVILHNNIGILEHHIHKVFATSRVPGEDYVYSASVELFNKLDDYCDSTSRDHSTELVPKPPLLIKGESGTGKSALLSNWLQRRELSAQRNKNNSALAVDEFIFWHAVGCSRQSMNVNFLIRRLIVDLKNRFELARDVPKTQERLSWELPRFLELASKKGKIIIVIDGLNRLINNDNSEDDLTWLPLDFPPNVRFIVSVTTSFNQSPVADDKSVQANKTLDAKETYNDDMKSLGSSVTNQMSETKATSIDGNTTTNTKSIKKNRILVELDRRNIPYITLKPLGKTLCRSLLETFVQKSVNNENSSLTTGPYISKFLNVNNAHTSHNIIPGFFLFESQIEKLLDHPLGGNPLFIRLFLRCLQFSVSRGYSLWDVFEDWIIVTSVTDLLIRIIQTFEEGYSCNEEMKTIATEKTLAAGGLPSLKVLYPWHPSFHTTHGHGHGDESSNNSITSHDANLKNKTVDGAPEKVSLQRKHTQQHHHHHHHHTFSAQMAADIKEGEEFEEYDKLHKNDKTSTITSTQNSVSQLIAQSLADQQMNQISQIADNKLQLALKQSYELIDETIISVHEKSSQDDLQLLNTLVANIKESYQADLNQNFSKDENGFTIKRIIDESDNFHNDHIDGTAPDEEDDEVDIDDSSVGSSSIMSLPHHEPITEIASRKTVIAERKRQDSLLHQTNHVKAHLPVVEVNPFDGLEDLPVYLRGGLVAAGFGELLGNALALLYVSRQGLQEKELWKVLSQIQHEKEKSMKGNYISKDMRIINNEIIRCLAANMLQARGALTDIFKADDISHSGVINFAQFIIGIRKVYPDIKKSDVRKLFEFIETNISMNMLKSSNGAKSNNDEVIQTGNKVHYISLYDLLAKFNRTYKFAESKLLNFNATSINIANKKKLNLKVEEVNTENNLDDEDYNNFNLKMTADVKKKIIDVGYGTITDDKENFNGNEEEEEDDENYSLGPVIEDSLLAILCTLGVLYSPENKLLILSSDSEPFRKVIYEKFILSRGGCTLQYWHQLLIHYFHHEPNSLRKCEELPWHLKICKKWNALKDILVDLRTFELMYNNDLKDELMEYWVLLTEGPLYVNDSSAETTTTAKHSKLPNNTKPTGHHGNLPANLTGNVHREDDASLNSELTILKEIDHAIEFNIPFKDIRKNMLRNQVQPFDIVEELNKTLEHWVITHKPQPVSINKTINQISRFLAEFSKLTKSSPSFLRIGIEMDALKEFSIALDEIKMDSISSALSSESAEEKDKNKNSQSDNMFESNTKEGPQKFPTEKMLSTQRYMYPYLRWIWMQFPWIALLPAANLNNSDNALLEDNDNSHNLEALENEQSFQSFTASDNARLLRVWNLKKSDPTLPVIIKSKSRQLGTLKPRMSLSASLEKNIEVSVNNLYDEFSSSNHIANIRVGFTSKDKYRRKFDEEVEVNKSVPYSYHTSKDNKAKSLFPSYNKMRKEESKKYLDDEFSISDTGSINSRNVKKPKKIKFNVDEALSGKVAPTPDNPTFFLTELDEDIRKISNDEYLQHFANTVPSGGHLIKDETDLEYVAQVERISKIKTIQNKLNIVKKEKMRVIYDLERQISLRMEMDNQLTTDVTNSELLIKALSERNINMEKSLSEAKNINEGYSELIATLKRNSPYDERHVASLEIEVSLAEKQFRDLCDQRLGLYKEADRLTNVRKREITERINYYTNARAEIAIKKQLILQENKQYKKDNKKRNDVNSRGNTQQRSRTASEADSVATSISPQNDDESEKKAIELKQPIIDFLNALARKKMGVEFLKNEDKNIEDVKKRNQNIFLKRDGEEVAKEEPVVHIINTAPDHDIEHMQSNLAAESSTSTMSVVGDLNSMEGIIDPNITDGQPIVNSPFIDSNQVAGMRHRVHKLVQFVVDRTHSKSADDFIERFHQNKKLSETLTSQQLLLDSKLAQLRLENQDLQDLWTDLNFSGEDVKEEVVKKREEDIIHSQNHMMEDQSVASSAVSIDTSYPVIQEEKEEDRYIDNRLFTREVRLNQLQQANKHAKTLLNEARTAVTHIMNILSLNNKLLHTLPKLQQPQLKTDSDILVCLEFCEERVMAISEALSMESNRPTGANTTDETKTIFERQTHLATLIMQSMLKESNKKESEMPKAKKQKKKGGLSKKVIHGSNDLMPSPRAVMVTSSAKIDRVYDSKMNKLITDHDRQLEVYEMKKLHAAESDQSNDLQKFLTDGLDSKNTKDMTRKAGLLLNKRSGRQINYGLVLEDLIVTKGEKVIRQTASRAGKRNSTPSNSNSPTKK